MQLASETANQIIDTDDLAFSGVFFSFLHFLLHEFSQEQVGGIGCHNSI